MRTIDIDTRSAILGALAFLAALLLAPAAEAEPQAASTRASASASSTASSSGGSSVSRASGSSSVSSRGGAAVTRSSGRGTSPGRRTTVRGVSRHRSHGHAHYRHGGYTGYPYFYHPGYFPYSSPYPYWSLSFGLGWWGGYYYGPAFGYRYPYYSPYYPYYGRPPAAARVYAEPVGAFDLNVKPKKTEVWVDGKFVGTAGRFDGFPDYLWLAEGEHQVVFFLPGYVTVERQVATLPGVVADLRVDMEPGRSTPARQLAVEPAPAPTYRQPSPAPPKAEKAESAEPATPDAAATPAAGGSLDLRQAPGRLVLTVAPEDASVYLDGRYLGTGRDLARLHAGLLIDSGEHRLEVVRPGYKDRVVEFSVTAGEEERLEIGLESG